MGHIGFDHRMCHGDITLGFKYGSTKTSDSERNIPVVTVISDKESSEEVVSLADSEGVDEKIRYIFYVLLFISVKTNIIQF